MVTAHFQKLINNVVGGFLFIVLWDRVSKPSRHPLQKSQRGGGARWASILPCVVVSDFSSMLFVLFRKQHWLTVHRIQCKKALCCEGILLRFHGKCPCWAILTLHWFLHGLYLLQDWDICARMLFFPPHRHPWQPVNHSTLSCWDQIQPQNPSQHNAAESKHQSIKWAQHWKLLATPLSVHLDCVTKTKQTTP